MYSFSFYISDLYHNYHNLVLPNLYWMNRQEIKANYSIDVNSAHSSRKGNEYHFGHYEPSHEAWKERCPCVYFY